MPFRRGGGKRKRDAGEPAIRAAYHAVGAQTWQISGTGLPDLLIFVRGVFYAVEVKTMGGRFTEAQRDIPWPTVRSVDQALAVIGIQDSIAT